MKFLWESLEKLSPESEFSGGMTYESIICVKGAKPSLEEVETKNAELEAAEPLRLLRQQRNQLLSATDWWVLPDRTATQAQLDYRQALRDLPTNSPNAALDEQGNLINVTWPTKPEA
jgi:hypothetical protein